MSGGTMETMQQNGDRRASEPFLEALRRARADYLEMPGLKLTASQAARLWALDASFCSDILAALVRDGFLTCTGKTAFVRVEER